MTLDAKEFRDLPRWTFQVTEHGHSIYMLYAKDDRGNQLEVQGLYPEKLLAWAHRSLLAYEEVGFGLKRE